MYIMYDLAFDFSNPAFYFLMQHFLPPFRCVFTCVTLVTLITNVFVPEKGSVDRTS